MKNSRRKSSDNGFVQHKLIKIFHAQSMIKFFVHGH